MGWMDVQLHTHVHTRTAEAGSLSSPAVSLADCYGACHCCQRGVQPLHGIQQGGLHKSLEHTQFTASTVSDKSQDCPLVSHLGCVQ